MSYLKWTKAALGSAVALSLLGAPAFAAAEYSKWNQNNDAGLDEQEFAAGFGENVGVFDKWDADNDGMLSQSEFDAGFGGLDTAQANFKGDVGYNQWDANNDDLLSEDEFYGGVFAAYDDDGSKIIEEPEFGDIGDDVGDGGFWDV